MQCISVRQPWAWLIVNGWKTIESRPWNPEYRGPLLIHTGQIMDLEARKRMELGGWKIPEDLPLGSLVGAVNLTDVIPPDQWDNAPWHDRGYFGWVLTEAAAFPEPIAYRGYLGLFEVPTRVAGPQLLATKFPIPTSEDT